MFVVTFYSFKGGVGRTMALANIGAWLAQNGRRVLLVDFDLEAPGLSSYALPNAREDRKGIVDYIHESTTDTPPRSLQDFYFQSFIGRNGGSLFVMPAGRRSTFNERLSTLDLGELYREREGFLLLENLKALWKSEIEPDYVLIDSRTGYNEASGICTRQLPDAVVLMFMPSPQNTGGVREIANQIRAQNNEAWRAPIRMHFLASNLPLIDDQRGEVVDAIEGARRELGFDQLLGTIFHFPSASHLTHKIFTLEFENSTLAKIYGDIARSLMMQNPADAEGAILLLDRIINREGSVASIVSAPLDDELLRIERTHRDNPKVTFKLARLRHMQGLEEESLALLQEVMERDSESVEPRLMRASLLGDRERETSEADLRWVLNRSDLDVIRVSRAIQNLVRISSKAYSELGRFKAYQALSAEDQASVLKELVNRPGGRSEIVGIIEDLLKAAQLSVSASNALQAEVVLFRIARKDFKSALALLGARPTRDSSIQYVFNYAVAEWGASGRIPKDLFEIAIELYEKNFAKNADSANYNQCIALAHAALGDFETATKILTEARQRALRSPRSHFSCWSYEDLGRKEFLDELEEMNAQLSNRQLDPPLLKRAE